MKSISVTSLIILLCLLPLSVIAQSLDTGDEILAQRGKGKVTQSEFTARSDKIPANVRQTVLRDSGRLRDVLNTLLMRAQLASDAREAGYDENTVIQDRMRLAADAELGEAWLQHYVEIQPAGDYERLARENYELNKQDMMSSEKIDVSHILVGTEERSSEEASTLANSLSDQIADNPALFDEMVETHSDDPSKSSNHGRFNGVRKGDMVKSFEEKAFSMDKGEISTPVQTQYGFHIIRLDEYHEPEMMSYEGVREQLIDSERNRHEERIKKHYLGSLSSLDVKMSKEALEEMVKRQLDEGNTETTE